MGLAQGAVQCDGENVDGESAGFMPYAGGGLTYFEFVRQVVEVGNRGYALE